MSDALLFLGCWLGAGVLAAVLFSRYKNRRPYLAARWDDDTGDWADETPQDISSGERADMSLADRALCERLWDLPTYSGGDHTTTNPTGDQTP